MRFVDPDIRRLMALRAIEGGLLRLKWLAAATRFEIALVRYDRALKANFNPNQPRVPRGNPGGGQWTSEGRATGQVRLAGDIPTGDSPEIPKKKPSRSAERTAILKALARRILLTGEAVAIVAKLNPWTLPYTAQIIAYNDPPKTLDELQKAASNPALGYDIHHIVEQTQAERDGFTREDIDSAENLVRIPRLKHQEINAWYQTENRWRGFTTSISKRQKLGSPQSHRFRSA